ncbi:unnamed protein product [Trichogramma brassicae]|uniref:Uncharacterized protein n=1 Tax=Trichogramma brassicae TaxID=86971 RepID=A0A6H5I0G7_9HYME|nr:unnamed protein product [Trichogramma brassicae]
MYEDHLAYLMGMMHPADETWESEEWRHGFLCRFDASRPVYADPAYPIPWRGEIDRLLIDCVHCAYEGRADAHEARKRFIRFVIRIGHRDLMPYDYHATRTIRLTTAVHHAVRRGYLDLVDDLFRVYDRARLNYADETGLTHLHAASMAGCHSVVRNFCMFGHDVSPVWRETGDTPLHLALAGDHGKTAALLLEANADVHRANREGIIPVQLVAAKEYDRDDELVWYLTEIKQGFFQNWTRQSLMRVSRKRLPLEICDMILSGLSEEDLWNMCAQIEKDRTSTRTSDSGEKKSIRLQLYKPVGTTLCGRAQKTIRNDPISGRKYAVHHAAKLEYDDLVEELFEICTASSRARTRLRYSLFLNVLLSLAMMRMCLYAPSRGYIHYIRCTLNPRHHPPQSNKLYVPSSHHSRTS